MKARKRFIANSVSVLVFSLFALFLVINSKICRERLYESLYISVHTVVPSVFPFAVAASIASYIEMSLPKFVSKPIAYIFGISENAVFSLVLGLFCGCPTGALSSVRLLNKGKISLNDATQVCALTCSPSMIYIISGVGEGFLYSKKIGVILYASLVFSVLVVGFLTRKSGQDIKYLKTDTDKTAEKEGFSLCDAFVSSLKASAGAMINITAFVAFFSQINLIIERVTATLNMPEIIKYLLFSLSEVSSACALFSALTNKNISVILSAFALSWGGISLKMQTLSLCPKELSDILSAKIVVCRSLISTFSLLFTLVFLTFGKIS